MRCSNVLYIKITGSLWGGITFNVFLPSVMFNGLNTVNKILNDICSCLPHRTDYLHWRSTMPVFTNINMDIYTQCSWRAKWTLTLSPLTSYYTTFTVKNIFCFLKDQRSGHFQIFYRLFTSGQRNSYQWANNNEKIKVWSIFSGAL